RRRRECRIESGEIAQESRGAMQPARRGALVVVEEVAGLREPRREPLGVLKPPPLDAQLVLLASPQPRRVELRDLQSQEILALRAIALGRSRALELGPRCPVPCE